MLLFIMDDILLLSVVRNCEKWIPQLKESIYELQYSFPNYLFYHFLFENDSSDGTKDMIKKYFSYYNIRNYNHANDKYMKSKRMAHYRNKSKQFLLRDFKGFSSHFKYIVLIDSGVSIDESSLGPLLQTLDENPDIAMACPVPGAGAVVSDIHGVRRMPVLSDRITDVSVCFDGMAVLRTDAFIKSRWSVNHYCSSEHTNFCWDVRDVGRIVIDKDSTIKK